MVPSTRQRDTISPCISRISSAVAPRSDGPKPAASGIGSVAVGRNVASRRRLPFASGGNARAIARWGRPIGPSRVSAGSACSRSSHAASTERGSSASAGAPTSLAPFAAEQPKQGTVSGFDDDNATWAAAQGSGRHAYRLQGHARHARRPVTQFGATPSSPIAKIGATSPRSLRSPQLRCAFLRGDVEWRRSRPRTRAAARNATSASNSASPAGIG